MLRRGLRQAAATAKQHYLAEHNAAVTVPASLSQVCAAVLVRLIMQHDIVATGWTGDDVQVLQTPAATSAPSWATPLPACQHLARTSQVRLFSSKSKEASAAADGKNSSAGAGSSAEQTTETWEAVDPKDQLIAEKDQQVYVTISTAANCAHHQAYLQRFMECMQVADYKDKLVHVLADMENLRDRTTRQAEQSRSFAIQVCPLVLQLCVQIKMPVGQLSHTGLTPQKVVREKRSSWLNFTACINLVCLHIQWTIMCRVS